MGWAAHQAVPYHTFSAEVLEQISGAFASSDFVKKTVGVDNVCERSALAGCESYGGGELICSKKQARDGITLAVPKNMGGRWVRRRTSDRLFFTFMSEKERIW